MITRELFMIEQVKLLRAAIQKEIDAARKGWLVGDANGADEYKKIMSVADAAWKEFEEFSLKHSRLKDKIDESRSSKPERSKD